MQEKLMDTSLVIQKNQKGILFTIGNAWFIENGETSESEASRNVEIKEVRVQVPLTSTKNKLMISKLTMNL